MKKRLCIIYKQGRERVFDTLDSLMETPSSPSSTITAPPDDHENIQRLAKLIVEAMTCRFAVLHYDSASKSMVAWCW
jgi:hypothetical protein